MKKFLGIVLVIVMTFSCCMFSVSAETFYDVTPSHWAYEHIMAMVEAGVVNGYTDGTFRPEDNITRGELAKMILLAADKGEKVRQASSGEHWAIPYMENMKSHTWTYEDWYLGKLEPDTVVNRSEVSMALCEFHCGHSISYSHKMNEVKSTLASKFSDAENIGGHSEVVYYVVTNNLMNGYEDGTFHPEWKITRAEMCAVLNRSFLSGSHIEAQNKNNDGMLSIILVTVSEEGVKLSEDISYSVLLYTNAQLANLSKNTSKAYSYQNQARTYFLSATKYAKNSAADCDMMLKYVTKGSELETKIIELKKNYNEIATMTPSLENANKALKILNETANILKDMINSLKDKYDA